MNLNKFKNVCTLNSLPSKTLFKFDAIVMFISSLNVIEMKQNQDILG